MKAYFLQFLKWDERVSSRIASAPLSDEVKAILKFLSHSCDSWYWMVGLIMFWIFSGTPEKMFAVTVAFVTGTLALFVLLIKFIIRRRRPDGDWGQIYRVNDPHSFPSGHAARAAAIVVVSAYFLPWWAVMLLFFWALLVAYSRVALKVHYLFDIIVGSGVGAFYAIGALWLFKLLIKIFPKIAQFLFHGF